VDEIIIEIEKDIDSGILMREDCILPCENEEKIIKYSLKAQKVSGRVKLKDQLR
jgi:hypothetical protein